MDLEIRHQDGAEAERCRIGERDLPLQHRGDRGDQLPPVVGQTLDRPVTHPVDVVRGHAIPCPDDLVVPPLFEQVHRWEAPRDCVRSKPDDVGQHIVDLPPRAGRNGGGAPVAVLEHHGANSFLLRCIQGVEFPMSGFNHNLGSAPCQSGAPQATTGKWTAGPASGFWRAGVSRPGPPSRHAHE